ncbi:hypothetical protein BDY24DRAFT_376696 [Mrakia frigida]|uniref:DUF4112 domain-containing protein n=1 Tax=Mrakia frigida TaxID=29902 RepID=UPI003FCBFE27
MPQKSSAKAKAGYYLLNKVGGKQAEKLFKEHLAQYTPRDPVYEEILDSKGRVKLVKRKLPAGLSKRDQKILRKVLKRARTMEKGFNILGFKVGYSFVVNLVPVAGDITGLLLNHILIVRKSQQADIPPWLLAQMTANNLASFGMGMVPFAGDVAGAVFKTNSRNALLLEEFLSIRGQEYLASQSPLKPANKADRDVIRPGAGAEPGEKIEKEGRSWWGGKKHNGTTSTATPSRVEGGRAVEMGAVGRGGSSTMAQKQVKR